MIKMSVSQSGKLLGPILSVLILIKITSQMNGPLFVFHRIKMTANCVYPIFAEIYCAYRNSVNNAFLRLFRYVRTDRTMTIII